MSRFRSRSLALALMLGSAIASRALVIYGGAVSDTNDRFTSGFPSSPTANTSTNFLGYGLDLSGVGWLTSNSQFGLTLISPQHFVIAAHVAPSAGASVSFLNQAGVVKNYTIDSVTTIQHTSGVNTDIMIGRLTAPISGGDLISSYSLLQLSTFGQYANLPLLVYGKNGQLGTNTLDSFLVNVDLLPFGGGNGVADSVLFTTDYDAIAGQSQGESGDSGSPTFYNLGGSLALLGVHSAIDVTAEPDLTYDSFLPSYYSKINTLLAADGFTLGAVTAIPEPAAVLWIPAMAAFGAVWRRRRQAA